MSAGKSGYAAVLVGLKNGYQLVTYAASKLEAAESVASGLFDPIS
jgi:hypothetical protein